LVEGERRLRWVDETVLLKDGPAAIGGGENAIPLQSHAISQQKGSRKHWRSCRMLWFL
jgi:hypothetical protein